MMSKWITAFVLLIGWFLLGTHCTPDPHQEKTHHGLMHQLKKYQEQIDYELTKDHPLDTTRLLLVHATVPGIRDFFTEKRSSVIKSFPCNNCHSRPLDQMLTKDTEKKAHWDIHLAHASEDIMNCTTCHASQNMNQLVSLTGKMIDINESFLLCGQCHSTQMKDWEGGAHGKSQNGWIPPKVVSTCVSCHNPHQPAFPSRFPARFNTKDPTN